MKTGPEKRDITKYYKFHRDHGHRTDDSIQLKKEIQRLIGRIAALSHFVSRSSDKCQPLFQVLKKAFH